jgi:hypothetical protein
MNKHKITRFLQSVVAIPMLAITTPMLGVTSIPSPTVVLSQNTIESQVITTPMDKIRKERADSIDKFFASRNAPLEGYGMKFVEEAEDNDIDWRLLAAISVIESNGGKQACKKADNSVLGYGSCKMSFKSIDESIELVSMKISGNTSKYYHDQMTTSQILKKYNSVIPSYVQKVTKVMKMIDDSEDII